MNQLKSFLFNARKLILLAIIAFAVILAGSSCQTQFLNPSLPKTQTEVANLNSTCPKPDNLSWLQVDGNWVKDEAGNKVTLRGISFCGFNNDWGEKALPNFSQKISEVTNGVNEWYPNLLRLPIKQRHLDSFSLEQIYQSLQAGVDECVKQKVYCIIDWHAVDGEKDADWRSPEMDQKTRDFWNYIAPRFQNNPNVLFEVYNEPGYPKAVTAENWLAWRDKAQEWVNLIRGHAPRNIILIGSPLWSQITQFAPQHPFAGTNLAYVNHTYPRMKESWPRDVGMEYDWEKVFGLAADRVPMFVSEFGWQGTGEWKMGQGTISDFGQPMKEFLNNRPNINWVVWTYDHYCSPRLVDRDGSVRSGEQEMGKFVQDWLKEEWVKETNPVLNCK